MTLLTLLQVVIHGVPGHERACMGSQGGVATRAERQIGGEISVVGVVELQGGVQNAVYGENLLLLTDSNRH